MIDEKKLIQCLKHDISCFETEGKKVSELYLRVDDMIRMIKGQPKIGRWILCRERKPESEKDVEITYVSKHLETGEPLCFTARAFYEDGTINTEDSSFSWEDTDNWEYDEEKDGYVIPEGWFESISFAEEFGVVDMPVIAWREIAEPYKPEEEDSEENEEGKEPE